MAFDIGCLHARLLILYILHTKKWCALFMIVYCCRQNMLGVMNQSVISTLPKKRGAVIIGNGTTDGYGLESMA